MYSYSKAASLYFHASSPKIMREVEPKVIDGPVLGIEAIWVRRVRSRVILTPFSGGFEEGPIKSVVDSLYVFLVLLSHVCVKFFNQ